MHQLMIRLQGGEGTTLADTLAALDQVRERILAGDAEGKCSRDEVGYHFEAREVDQAHAFTDLLGRRHNPEYRVATLEDTRDGTRT